MGVVIDTFWGKNKSKFISMLQGQGFGFDIEVKFLSHERHIDVGQRGESLHKIPFSCYCTAEVEKKHLYDFIYMHNHKVEAQELCVKVW